MFSSLNGRHLARCDNGVSARSLYVPHFKFWMSLDSFHETWYENYEQHPSVVFIFLQTGTNTWRNCELLICDRH